MSPSNPEAGSVAGGVAIFAKSHWCLHHIKPRTAAYAQAFGLGRAIMAILAPGGHFPILVASVYGWATEEGGEKLGRTSALLSAVFEAVSYTHLRAHETSAHL
eukprot:6814726-Alexandrium_andersonii.AAC.1